MSCPTLKPQILLGLRTDVKQNAHFISDKEIFYPVGAVLTIQDYHQQTQRHIQLMEKSIFLETIIVSPTRSMAAIVLNDERGHIVIYDLKSLKKKRTLNLPHDASTKRFEHACFSYDEKLLLTLTGHPDWLMLSYHLEKGKVETFTRANYINNPGPVSQVLCSPADSAMCCLIGPSLLRLMSMAETVWRQYGFQKADLVNITTAAFLSGDRILFGTEDGKLLIIDDGDLQAVYDAVTVSEIVFIEKTEGGVGSAPVLIPKPLDSDEDRRVRTLVSFSKGFAYSCRIGQVHMFEKEEKNKFKRRNLFVIRDEDFREVKEPPLNIVQHLSLNPTQDQLMATTNRSQIYIVRLWGPLISTAPEIPFKHLGESLHHGPISGLSMCSWKPNFITCGAQDRTVRLWNYETSTLEMIKQYEEDIFSVALHPTGLFAALGFTDKLRYMIVLLDDVKPFRSLPIAECRLSVFSSHGHYLAAVSKSSIEVYSTITFQLVWTLKGHWGKVSSIIWTPDDRKLASCGTEGAVYEWDMMKGERVGDTVDKKVCYWECCVTSEGKFIYAAGNNGKISEICQSQLLRTFNVGQSDLPHIFLSRSDKMMFICGDAGVVLTTKLPLTEPVQTESFLYHNLKILKMKLTHDDKTLITVCEAGLLSVWHVIDTEGGAIVTDPNFTYCMDLLIPKTDLEEKVTRIAELKKRIQELVMEHEFVMRQTDATQASAIEEMHKSYKETIAQLNKRIVKNENDYMRTATNQATEIIALREIHEKALEDLESRFSAKLIVEYDKYDEVQAEKEEAKKAFDAEINNTIEKKENEIKEISSAFMEKIEHLEKLLIQAKQENDEGMMEHEAIKQLIEDDADREIVELKAKYERILKDERETIVMLRGETGVTRKKLLLSQEENGKYKLQIDCLQQDQQKSENTIEGLQRDIMELKREIYERDLTIQDKEKRIYDMKKKTEELEKYKFVLGHKIDELSTQLQPKEAELIERDKQIAQMEQELEKMQLVNGNLKVKIEELKDKQKSTEQELRKIREKAERNQSALFKIKLDIADIVEHLQNFKQLKKRVKSLYETHAQGDDTVEIHTAQAVLQKEFSRQRIHLEHSVGGLQQTLHKLRHNSGPNDKLMQDNVTLIEEINELKKAFKHSEEKVRRYESLFISSLGKEITLKEAKRLIGQATKNQEDIRQEMITLLTDSQKEVSLLKNEVVRMRRQNGPE